MTDNTIDQSKQTVVGNQLNVAGDLIQYVESQTIISTATLSEIEQRPPTSGAPPYKGLTYFTEADKGIYFGRETLSDQIVNRLEDTRFLAIIGASGSGKSSLLRAGLIPRLRALDWNIHLLKPGKHPLRALDTTPILDTAESDTKLAEQNQFAHTLVAVDQFEEIFTLCEDAQKRQAFVDRITQAVGAGGAITVLLCMRADFYDRVSEFPVLTDLIAQHQEYIKPMKPTDLVRVIAEPARRGGWQFIEGLVEQIITDVGHEPGRLPLLAHALRETWEQRRGTVMTLGGYRNTGGVEGAIARTADSTLEQLTPKQIDVAREIFLSLTELGEGTEDTRRVVSRNDLAAGIDEDSLAIVLEALVQARLLTTDREEVEVAHEALIRRWPTLQEWLADNRERLRFERRLARDAALWREEGEDESALYRGARLAQAIELADASDAKVTELSDAFLVASRELAEREHRRMRRRALYLFAASASMFIAVILALVFFFQSGRNATRAENNLATATIALGEAENEKLRADNNAATAEAARQNAESAQGTAEAEATRALSAEATAEAGRAEAERQAQISLGLSLAASAPRLAENKPGQDDELATLLALEALRLKQQTNGRFDSVLDGALRPILTQDYYSAILGVQEGGISSVAFSPDGRMLASSGGSGPDGIVQLWMLPDPFSSGELPTPIILENHRGTVRSVAFAPDGQTLASADRFGSIRLWDLSGPISVDFPPTYTTLLGHDSFVNSVAFSPDGQILASGGNDRIIRLWDVSSPTKAPIVLEGHESKIESVAFSPDGQILASGDWDGIMRLWDVSSHMMSNDSTSDSPISAIEVGLSRIEALSFSPDGQTLAVGGTNHTDRFVQIWDVLDFELLDETPSPVFLGDGSNERAEVSSLSYSPDAQTLAVGRRVNHTVQLWDLNDPNGNPITLQGHRNYVQAVTFSPDGRMLASADSNGVIRLWTVNDLARVDRPSPYTILEEVGDSIWSLAYSPEGNMLAASGSGRVSLWDMSSQTEDDGMPTPATLQRVTSGANALAFSPDGQVIAYSRLTAGPSATIQLRDVIDLTAAPIILEGHEAEVLSLAFDYEGNTLASASKDGTIRIWSMSDLTATPKILDGSQRQVNSVAFAPDGQLLASGGTDDTVRLWNLTDLTSTDTLTMSTFLEGHMDDVLSLSFAPDGHTLASAGKDSTIRLWDLAALSATNIPTVSTILRGHEGTVRSIAFAPDGRMLASAGEDRTIRLWDVSDPSTAPIILEGYTTGVKAVAFAPDGQTLASAGLEDVRLWSLSFDKLKEAGCFLSQRNLTWAEWQLYLPVETEYRCTCANRPIHPSVLEAGAPIAVESCPLTES